MASRLLFITRHSIGGMVRRLGTALYWGTSVFFCAILYWRGIVTWFVQDDFGWLGLRNLVTDLPTFLWAMFAPLAQGTVRAWSERGYFLFLSSLFGVNPLPFRVCEFATQFVNLVLIAHVTRKITRSDTAAFLSPLLWLVNPALVVPMAWISAYNQIQCAAFLLLSLALFIRFAETGERKWLWAQYVSFGLGFGSNELNVVYPLIAGTYASLFAPRRLKTTIPMFVASAAFTLVERWFAEPATGDYAMSFHPFSLWLMFTTYSNMMFSGLEGVWHAPLWKLLIISLLLVFVAIRARQRDYASLFGGCWFVIVLCPFLLLPKHITSYYVMIPSIGLVLAAADGIAQAWKSRIPVRIAASAIMGIYLTSSTVTSYKQMAWHYERAERARALVQAVEQVKRKHPDKVVLLGNIDKQLFWAAIYDRPFSRAYGWRDVFLTPENRALVPEVPQREALDGYFFPQSSIGTWIENGSAIVCTYREGRLWDTTAEYASWLRM